MSNDKEIYLSGCMPLEPASPARDRSSVPARHSLTAIADFTDVSLLSLSCFVTERQVTCCFPFSSSFLSSSLFTVFETKAWAEFLAKKDSELQVNLNARVFKVSEASASGFLRHSQENNALLLNCPVPSPTEDLQIPSLCQVIKISLGRSA